MTKLSLFTIGLFFFSVSEINAQGVGVNTAGNPPDPSAIFDASSTTQGTLITRMTTAERDAIVAPAQSLLIYNTTTNCFNFYNNGGWFEICGTCIPPEAPIVNNNGPVCEGNVLSLSASTVPGAGYAWSGPNSFSSNDQNPVVSSSASMAMAGTYHVVASLPNGCTSSVSSTTAVVNAVPQAASTIMGPANVCAGQNNVNYSVAPIPGASGYMWSFPDGVSIGSGNNTNSVTVDFSEVAVSGDITVYGTSPDCGNGPVSLAFAVSVEDGPGSSQTFSYTGSAQTFTVPPCVTSVTIDAYGAQGGAAATGGRGGQAKGSLDVTPGQTLYVYVGQAGTGTSGGWNGGGTGNTNGNWHGGGASDVRVGGTALANRVIVAGGGGGSGLSGTGNPVTAGGGGGGNVGGSGSTNSTATGGGGGTQSAGGAAGTGSISSCNGTAGSLGQGGSAIGDGGCAGGGGGGYRGGGAGGSSSGNLRGGGGGGSNYLGGVSPLINSQSVRSGHGEVIISW